MVLSDCSNSLMPHYRLASPVSAPSNHEVGELAQKFQSQINTSFEEAEKSHKSR